MRVIGDLSAETVIGTVNIVLGIVEYIVILLSRNIVIRYIGYREADFINLHNDMTICIYCSVLVDLIFLDFFEHIFFEIIYVLY